MFWMIKAIFHMKKSPDDGKYIAELNNHCLQLIILLAAYL